MLNLTTEVWYEVGKDCSEKQRGQRASHFLQATLLDRERERVQWNELAHNKTTEAPVIESKNVV